MGSIHSRRVLKIGMTLFAIMLLISVPIYLIVKQGLGYYILDTSYFTVVVDCGSTGTRVNLYEWKIGGGMNRNLPILLHSYPGNLTVSLLGNHNCQYHCIQTEPGLDKFVGNASGVRTSLEPLIMWAKQLVPQERRKSTPIFVLATAGLRRLHVEDARRVLIDVMNVVKEHEFMYKKTWIRVLSGKEEAYYGWVALNFKLGIFGNASRMPTLGLLDLGGSSLQVVAEIDELKEDGHVLTSKIGVYEHQISAYSLPAFGLNEAFDRALVMLSRSPALREGAGGTFEIAHPCLNSGFVQNYTCHGCLRKKSTNLEDFSEERGIELNSIFLVGEPNWENCKLLTKAIAINSNSSDWLQLGKYSNCPGNKIIDLTARTNFVGHFHALSAFFAVYNMLNLSPKANLTKIWEKGQQLCSRTWTEITSNSERPKYAEQYCFRVPYLASLIQEALCLGNEEIIFGPKDISWTLGAALIEGKFLWHGTSKSWTGVLPLKSSVVVLSPIFLFVILACLLYFVYQSGYKFPMPSRKAVSTGASLPSYINKKRHPV